MEGEARAVNGPIAPLLDARHLSKRYVQGRWLSRDKFRVSALDDVSVAVYSGYTLALVGESGSGKSTLGRCLSRLETPDSGEIWFEGRNLLTLSAADSFAARRRIQLIFQDSAMAMNPRFSALEVIEEPLRIQTDLTKKARREQALAMMEQVGLSRGSAQRSPLEFSGGQRQRLTIARALVLRPTFLILDEALSGLDLSIQAQITNLLLELQASLSLTYLYITHDLRSAACFARDVAVMWKGKIVESGAITTVFSHPKHAYSRLLVDAIPGVKMESPAFM